MKIKRTAGDLVQLLSRFDPNQEVYIEIYDNHLDNVRVAHIVIKPLPTTEIKILLDAEYIEDNS